MSLSRGTRIGRYEIVKPIGAGGMGEVYLAHDTTLDRDVAIKTLLPAVAGDASRLARFSREAKVLASLNQPNIAAIYGLEQSDGVTALVMELVEGTTLAERIGASGLPVDEAIRIARQIADALDAAHEKGIVHRDLKPANVKVTPGGMVKVLDFGLAKQVLPAGAVSQVQTIEAPTHDGTLIGTVDYMSPEQARGLDVDKRTDIWAFGCVLYEMLSGRRAFGAATVSDTLAAIIHKEPDWPALPADLHPAIHRLIRRCLDKDARRRLRDIGDVNALLDEAAAEAPMAATTTARQRRKPSSWLLAIAAAIVLVGGSAMVWRALRVAPAPEVSLGPILPFTFDPGLTTDPSLSSDGRLIAYASDRAERSHLDVYVQQTTGGTAIRLTNDAADDHEPDISPDGSLVAFRSERAPAGVYVAPALGGAARLLAPDGRAPRFSPDGKYIAYEVGSWLAPIAVINSRRVFIVPAAGGAPTQLAADLVNAGAPTWAPDGKSLLVLARKGRAPADVAMDWWQVPIDPTRAASKTGTFGVLERSGLRLALDTPTMPYPRVWTDDGVFFSATTGGGDSLNLFYIAVDAAARPVASPVRLTQGTTLDSRAAVSRNGRVVWLARTQVRAHFGFPLDAAGRKLTGEGGKLHDDMAPSGRSAISTDGRLLVFARYGPSSGNLWLRDLVTGEERQLVATPRTPINPAISRDGRWIGYTVTMVQTGANAGFGDGFVLETSGGVPRKVCENCEVSTWTPDGRVVVNSSDRKMLVRIDVMSGERRDLVETSADVDRPNFGPDGRFVIFNMPGRIVHAPVYPDRATPETEWSTVLETAPPTERTAGISPDGGLLYMLLEKDGFRCVYGLTLDSRTGLPKGEPFPVVHIHRSTLRWGSTGYGSAAGAGLFVADLFESRGNIWMSELVRPES